MKKLFLIPLLACFFCIGAYALTVVSVATESELREALATEDSVEVTLMADIEGESTFIVNPSAHVLLNLNGHSLSSTFNNDQLDIENNGVIYNLGSLHIVSRGDGIVQMPVNGADAGVIINSGTLIIDGGIFLGKLVYLTAGGELMGFFMKAPVIWQLSGSTVINGGTFLMDPGQYVEYTSHIEVEGEDLMYMAPWEEPLMSNGGTWNIKGGVFAPSKGVSSKFNADLYEGETISYSNSLANYNNAAAYLVHPKFTEDASLTTSNKSTSVEVAENADVTLSEGDYAANFVYVEEGSKVTIESGATLVVEDKFVLEGENAQLEIQPGATLVVKNEVLSSNEASIALTVNDKDRQYSNLLVAADNIQESHPKATVDFGTKAKYNATAGKFIWQRFAVPTHATFNYDDIVKPDVVFEIQGWDYENNCWKVMGPGSVLEPFQMYALTISSLQDTAHYKFPCELVGNGNPSLTLREGWNYFANAYTAPMSLKDWLVDLMTADEYIQNDARIIDGSVWVQAASTRWIDFRADDVLDEDFDEDFEDYVQLQPMQAFVYHSNVATEIPLKYKEYVYDPIVNDVHVSPAHAPRKMRAEDYKKATISIKDANDDEELLRMYEGEQFTDDFDEDFDLEKLMNEEFFNAYFVTPIGDLSRLALSDLDSANISFKTFEAGEFTMTFKSVTLENYVIVDNLTEIETEIKKGNEYKFSGEAHTLYSNRFTIINKGSSTAIDNVETNKATKGVYTITGQYVGKDLNVLPAGVYVVNGKKVVK